MTWPILRDLALGCWVADYVVCLQKYITCVLGSEVLLQHFYHILTITYRERDVASLQKEATEAHEGKYWPKVTASQRVSGRPLIPQGSVSSFCSFPKEISHIFFAANSCLWKLPLGGFGARVVFFRLMSISAPGFLVRVLVEVAGGVEQVGRPELRVLVLVHLGVQ